MSNRLFDIFDQDKSGTLELDQFLNYVNYLQNADENQKFTFNRDSILKRYENKHAVYSNGYET